MDLRRIRKKLTKRLGLRAISDIVHFVKNANPPLWAEKQSRGFLNASIYITLYLDVFRSSYSDIIHDIQPWYTGSTMLLKHNQKVLHAIFAEWGKRYIQFRSIAAWERAKTKINVPKGLEDVDLWLDSTDISFTGKSSVSQKSSDWSYKENRPAQRYMCMSDALGYVIRFWGGYSPKVYDGQFLTITQNELNEDLRGATVIADTHFELGPHILPNVCFCTPYAAPRGKPPLNMKGERVLTSEQEKWNRKKINQTWGCLVPFFKEDKEQMDYVVTLAIGVHNFRKK